MEVRINGLHMEVTQAMEKHIRERIEKLPRFDNDVQHVTVTLANESGGPYVEVIAKCHKSILVANSRGHEMYESIDKALSKLERRVTRFHDKLISRHSREAHRASESDRRPQQ